MLKSCKNTAVQHFDFNSKKSDKSFLANMIYVWRLSQAIPGKVVEERHLI
tara:strand:- start:317 stop:466 length:150 start_codon:yes stop_codon:yes gene_type:complete